jgi:hypothetical protein
MEALSCLFPYLILSVTLLWPGAEFCKFLSSLNMLFSMLTFNFGSLLEGLTAIKDCENAANSFLWYTDTDWRDIDTNRRATSVQPYDRAYTSLDHHFSCEEGFYNGRGSVLRPLFEYPFNRIQLIYFDFLHVFPSSEHWEKSYIYSTQDQAGKVFRKSCITVRVLIWR